MEDLQEKFALLSRNNPNFREECKRIANEVTSKRTTILEVALSLDPYFSSNQVDQREAGLHVLSTILECMPITTLSEEEFIEFCRFYKRRMNDNFQLISALLNGILALSTYNLLIEERGFTEILTTMFQTVSCQSQKREEKLKIYKIFQNMLRNQTAELIDLGPDFVYGVISAIDGERDPSNLIFIFEWMPEFINTIKLGHLTQDLHDVISCYFPVDFRVSAHEANGVSRDDLAEALTPCLCATTDFAEMTLPLALEKVDSDLQIAQCDALHLLIYGCNKFTAAMYVKNGIWSELQKQLFKNPSPEVEALLIVTITEMSRKLSADHMNFKKVFDDMLDTNEANLNDTEKFFVPTCKLFLAMSTGNEACAKRIMPVVQRHLITLLLIQVDDELQFDILRQLIEFIKIGDRYNINAEEIPGILMTLAMEVEETLGTPRRVLSMEALCFVNSQFEDVKERLLFEWKLYFSDRMDAPIRNAFHHCIRHYSRRCATELTTLVKSLVTVDVDVDFGVLMENLCGLSSTEPFVELFAELLNQHFETHTTICLEQLHNALKLDHGNEALCQRIEALDIIESKVLCLYKNGNIEPRNLLNLMNILMHIVGSYTVEQQRDFLEKHFPSVLNQFQRETDMIFFIAGILSNLDLDNLSEFGILEKLFALSCTGQRIAPELLANMINKLPADVIGAFLVRFHGGLSQHVPLVQVVGEDHYGVTLLWLTKALYMRAHESALQWSTLLMEYMKHSQVIANGMETILSDDCPLFSGKSHCRRNFLYKQRFFIDACQLLDGCFTVDNNNYIVAFGSLLQGVPSAIFKTNFEKLMRLIVLCLDHSPKANGIIPILSAIKSFIETRDALCKRYFEDFLPRLLYLSQFPSSMKVRILALECIQMYSHADIPMLELVKHKNDVTAALSKCVDDRKRLVRKAAADARLKWFLLGAPI